MSEIELAGGDEKERGSSESDDGKAGTDYLYVFKRQFWTSSLWDFLKVDHLRGDYRCYELHILALFGVVVTAYSLYTNTNSAINRSANYSDNWSSCIGVVTYVMVCVPIAFIYQATTAANSPGAASAREVYSAVVTALVIAFLSFDVSRQRGSDGVYVRVILGTAIAAWGIVFLSTIYFWYVNGENMPRIFRHKAELQRARNERVADLLKERRRKNRGATTTTSATTTTTSATTESSRKKKKKVQKTTEGVLRVALNFDVETVEFDKETNVVTLRKLSNNVVEDVGQLFFLLPEEEEEDVKEDDDDDVKEEESMKARVMTKFLGPRREPWYEGYLRRSRPPLMLAATFFAFLVLAILAAVCLGWRVRILGKIANDLDDVSKNLEALAPTERRLEEEEDLDEFFSDALDTLRRAAHKLNVVENDWNNSWLAGASLSLVILLGVASTYVPRFDAAIDKAKRGQLPKHLARDATFGKGTAIFGSLFSIVGLGYVLNALVLSVIIFVFVNDDVRNLIWSYRVYILSYCISLVIKSYILQPYLFHKYASYDGKVIKREAAFYLCDVAWIAYGVIVGATVSLMRILYYVLYSFVAVALLDETILPAPVRSLDSAYLAFWGLVYAHHRHHNDVVHVAVDQLRRHRDQQNHDDDDDDNDEEKAKKELLRRTADRARTRWHLAYTLLNNPKLRAERRSGPPAPPSSLGDDDTDDDDGFVVECRNDGDDTCV